MGGTGEATDEIGQYFFLQRDEYIFAAKQPMNKVPSENVWPHTFVSIPPEDAKEYKSLIIKTFLIAGLFDKPVSYRCLPVRGNFAFYMFFYECQ